jgi:uncharacterized protein DUF3658
MNKAQAADIQKHLLEAAAAIGRASAAIFALGEERRAFARPLGEISVALHFELLRAVYDQYPELKPPEEEPAISSTLCWDEVVLPSSVTEADVDAILFSVLKQRLQKVAMVVGLASKRSRELDLPTDPEAFSARLRALAEAGRIEAKGDLRKWGHSEVCLRG